MKKWPHLHPVARGLLNKALNEMERGELEFLQAFEHVGNSDLPEALRTLSRFERSTRNAIAAIQAACEFQQKLYCASKAAIWN